MTYAPKWAQDAFESDSPSKKDIALRLALDQIKELKADIDLLRRSNKCLTNELQRVADVMFEG
jgi:hypothetical protein